MKCPWQVKHREYQEYFTDNKSGHPIKVTDQEFRECLKEECPFWTTRDNSCIRPHGNV